MQLTINVAVTSDDGKVEKTVTGRLMVATGVYGTDAGVAKQDFLDQAEALVRVIAENQIPALYGAVQQEEAKQAEAGDTKDKKKLHDKLKAIHDKRRQKAKQQDEQQAQDETQQEDQVQEEAQEDAQTQEEEQ